MTLSRILHASAVALALLAGACHREPEPAPRAPAQQATASYASLLADVDRSIVHLQAEVDRSHNSWTPHAQLAVVLMKRASLTQRPEDYARVERVLGDAFAIAPEGSGPLYAAARFHFSVHRLDRAEAFLATMDRRAVPREVVEGKLLRAEIALQRGRYADGLALLREVEQVKPELARPVLALYHGMTGRPAEAERLFQEELATTDDRFPEARARLALQLGISAMEHGRYDEALTKLRAADAGFPGWWLIEEHIAEVHTLMGEDAAAVPIYEEVLRHNELPQYLDALAGCYARMGRAPEAAELVTRAGSLWEKQLAELPESAMGHGLEHYLEHGSAARALELAKQNHALRPGGPAHVLLAEAYLKAGDAAAARDVCERALATPFRSADLHAVAARAYASLGLTEKASEQRALCQAIDPHACE
jgi:tetratricopeptide (TPR) repeat protein